MNEYTVFDKADESAYQKTVAVIERAFPELTKTEPPKDVDGSSVTVFMKGKNKVIKVYKDFDYDEVLVQSEIDLSSIDFSKIKESA